MNDNNFFYKKYNNNDIIILYHRSFLQYSILAVIYVIFFATKVIYDGPLSYHTSVTITYQ